jgi:MFS family permease
MWAALRYVYGLCYAGMMLVVESWINAEAPPEARGRVLAIYGIVFMTASAVGQGGIAVATTEGILLFCVVSVAVSIALVPPSLIQIREPETQPYGRTSIAELVRLSPFGVTAITFSGLLSSAFWGLLPRYGRTIGLANDQVALVIAVAILGATVFQLPIGHVSDRVDRRVVVVSLAAVSTAASAAIATGSFTLDILLLLSAAFGASTLPLYSVGLAHVHDHVRFEHLIDATATAVFLFGVASGIGPVAAGVLMSIVGSSGLFLYSGTLTLLFVGYGLVQIQIRRPLTRVQKRVSALLPRTTQLVARLVRRRHRSGGA